MANFCVNRTPFQTVMMLMLAVIIPFLIILGVIYALAMITESSEGCVEFCMNNPSNGAVAPIKTANNSKNKTSNLTSFLKEAPREIFICQKDLREEVKYPFIASILQSEFNEDTLHDLTYLCSGAIISNKWIISSTECIGPELFALNIVDILYVRVGSPYWSTKGAVHKVKQIIHPPVRESQLLLSPMIIAIEVKYSFLKSRYIKPLRIPTNSMFKERAEAEVFSWHADSNVMFYYRKKNLPLIMYSMEIYKQDECTLFKNRSSVFCGEEFSSRDFCDLSKGGPIVKDNYLMGVHIAVKCSQEKREHYFTDIVHYYNWLKVVTKFHHFIYA